MASTRDKRLKTDSPTPVQPIEPLSVTPTVKPTSTAIKLKRMSRNRSGVLSVKSENEDGNDSMGLSEDTQSSTASVDAANLPKTPNTRTKRQPAKDDKEEESNGDGKETEESSKDPDTPRTRKPTKAQMMKKKSAVLALARRQAMMKRKTLPLPIKSSNRVIGRRLSGVAKAEEGGKEEEKAAVRKGKPGRKSAAEKLEKKEITTQEEEAETAPEPEVDAEAFDKSEDINESEASMEVNIKQEKNASAVDLLNVRRSTRQRKSTIKDRDSPFTGRRSQALDKSDTKRDSISPALSTVSIKAEKESSKAISITVEPSETNEKDPSLSPELVSEEMDTESVQHLYDKPDFLENNLGIEQDPKLGEMVKVQEKTKVVESVIKTETPVTTEDIEIKPVAEKKDLKGEEKIGGGKNKEKVGKAVEDPDRENVGIKKEPESVDEASIEKTLNEKEDESDGENKENNIESSAKSVGSISPRSEDSLKIVPEENLRKADTAECDLIKQKESHLMTLGLLTHKAADEAKLAKLKRKEELSKTIPSQPASRGKPKKDSYSYDPQYTGTLKTIIKLNRSDKDKRRTREPLKLTIQKKNRDRDSNGSSNSSESFYTIQEVSLNLQHSF